MGHRGRMTTVKQTLRAETELREWDEEVYADDPHLARASVQKWMSGDLDAISTSQYVMAYEDDGTAVFTGIEHITGRIGERAGTLVLTHVGKLEDGVARAEVTVVSGASSDELAGATGSGSFASASGAAGTLELDLRF
jgi:hypothetical protein